MSEQLDSIDFALAAYRESGEWQVQDLAAAATDSVPRLVEALHRLPGEDGAVGMVGIDEDFFVVVRVHDGSARVLLSDITAADQWDLAQSALDYLGVVAPLDREDPVAAGDLDLLHDLGFHTMDMAILLEDSELYPDEQLSTVAASLGFGEQFDDHVGITAG